MKRDGPVQRRKKKDPEPSGPGSFLTMSSASLLRRAATCDAFEKLGGSTKHGAEEGDTCLAEGIDHPGSRLYAAAEGIGKLLRGLRCHVNQFVDGAYRVVFISHNGMI